MPYSASFQLNSRWYVELVAATGPTAMNSPRLSALFLGLAAIFGVCGIGLRSTLELDAAWGDALSFLCVGALAAFVVTFLMTLDKSALLRK